MAGCLPAITTQEMRMVMAQPRGSDCELQFLELKIEDMAPMTGAYELLGNVTLFDRTVKDPLTQSPTDPRYKELVRPRACAMGGEAVNVMMQAQGRNRFGQMGGGALVYGVVRKRAPPGSPPPPPGKF